MCAPDAQVSLGGGQKAPWGLPRRRQIPWRADAALCIACSYPTASRALHCPMSHAPPHGQALVDVGFKLATIPLESLRPYGVRLLALLVTLFGDVPDPLLHGAWEQILWGTYHVLLLVQSTCSGHAVLFRWLPSWTYPTCTRTAHGATYATCHTTTRGGQGTCLKTDMPCFSQPATAHLYSH